MSKIYYEIINTYGKSSGEEVTDSGVIEDTKENREELIDEWSWSDSYFFDSKDNFINGNRDSVSFSLDGGDWDEPTGREIVITTYETRKAEIERRYHNDLKSLNALFGIESSLDQITNICKDNFYNWQNIETVATKMSLRYDTLMQEKDNPTAKQSFELDIFRSWGGLETNDLAFKEWVIATISVYNNQPIESIVNKLKTEHITFNI